MVYIVQWKAYFTHDMEVTVLGYLVREAREKKGITQEELAERSGISRQTISAIENDVRYSAGIGTLSAIARALEMKVDDLFFDERG